MGLTSFELKNSWLRAEAHYQNSLSLFIFGLKKLSLFEDWIIIKFIILRKKFICMPQNIYIYIYIYIYFNVKAILVLKQLLLMRIFFCKMNDVKMYQNTSKNEDTKDSSKSRGAEDQRLTHRIDDPTTEHKRQGCISEG